jgi:hypothetical protein
MPAFGNVSAPWHWKPVEVLTSAIHHTAYAAGTIVAYRWLAQRRRS